MTIVKIIKWAGIASAAVLVLLAALVFAVVTFFPAMLNGPSAPPLQLPPLSATAPSGSPTAPNGTWIVGSGSFAGFRAQESFLSQSGTIVGRTSTVNGSLAISHGQIVSASFQVDLSKLTLGGKPNPSFFTMLKTQQYPYAALTLTSPIAFATIPAAGQAVAANAVGTVTIRGTSHPGRFTLTGRYDGAMLAAAGTAPILASDWGIQSPFGIHDNDVIEFLVILRQS